jgi:hypothetical protein
MGQSPANYRHRETRHRLKARSGQAQRIPPARLCAGNGASGPPVKAGMSETLSGTVLLHLKLYLCGLGFFCLEIYWKERNF